MRHVLIPALATVAVTATAAIAAPLVKPYVQAGTPTGMTVMWHSSAAAPGMLVVTQGGKHVKTVNGPTTTHHELRVEGLAPGTTYGYAAFDGTATVGTGTFKTSPAPGTARSFRFAVVGDTGSGNANQQAVADQMAAWKPDFVLVTGDVVYEKGEEENYRARFFKPYQAMIGSTVFYPSLGNHDYGLGHVTAYERFFDVPGASGKERWYTFTHGDAQFFALDSNLPFHANSEQTRWLASELAQSTAPWKFAFFHHPPYSSGSHGSSLTLRQAWSPLFEKHDVQVVFTGHDHHYERISPREDFVKDGKPTTYVVTGGGGAWLRKVKPQHFTASSKLAYHFLGVTVEGEQLRWEAIDKAGAVFDRTTVKR